MLYQLSYSPKELDDLAATFDGYTSAVCAKRTCTLNAETWQEDNRKKPIGNSTMMVAAMAMESNNMQSPS